MAKDDYNVLVYKILLYAYAVFQKKIVFDNTEFKMSLLKDGIDEGYLDNILKLMQDDMYISGLSFHTAWGKEIMLINDYSDMQITSYGIEHMNDNSTMEQAKKFLIDNVDVFASLIKIVFPI